MEGSALREAGVPSAVGRMGKYNAAKAAIGIIKVLSLVEAGATTTRRACTRG